MTVFTAFVSVLAADAPTPPGGGLLGNPMIMIGLMVVMFYFLLIRPQQVQRKQQLARIAALQPGTKVVTTSGIHGLVHSIKERTVTLKVAEGTMIEFDKSVIAVVVPKESGDSKK